MLPTDPYLIREEAARIVGEDRVPTDELRQLLIEHPRGASAGTPLDAAINDARWEEQVNAMSPWDVKEEAASVIGEDRVATDALTDLLETYGVDEDRDADA